MEALRHHPRNFLVVLGARMAENGLGYFFPVFGLSYVIKTLGVPNSEALSALMLAFVIELFAILGFAALSDRVGRRPVYLFGALAGVALAFPFFWMVGTKQWIWIALAFILARAVVTAAMFGPQAAYFAELFPPQRRFAGFAFARELGSLLSGGPAPFVATALVAAYGSWWPVACYAIVPVALHGRSRSGSARRLTRRTSLRSRPILAKNFPRRYPSGPEAHGATASRPAIAVGDGAAADG